MNVVIDCESLFTVTIHRDGKVEKVPLDNTVEKYKNVITNLIMEHLLPHMTLDDEEIIDQEITEMFIPYAEYDPAFNDLIVTENLYDVCLTLFTLIRHTVKRIRVNEGRFFDPLLDSVSSIGWLGHTLVLELKIK
jgi:hypothetical protein